MSFLQARVDPSLRRCTATVFNGSTKTIPNTGTPEGDEVAVDKNEMSFKNEVGRTSERWVVSIQYADSVDNITKIV